MATIIDPPNSVWPNGLKVDSEGYVTFYPLGTNKVDINTITWPDGDKLVSPFVYKDDKLVGFVDTEALTVSGSATTTMNYSHIEADFASISEGKLTVNAPNATVKKFSWSVVDNDDSSFDYIIIDFNNTYQATLDAVRAAYKVVDKKMYAEDGSVIGTWDTSKIELAGIADEENGIYDGLYAKWDADGNEREIILTEFTSDLSSLTDGSCMFAGCSNLTSFSSDLSSLTDSFSMFDSCSNLTSFSSDLPSLTNGYNMFYYCKNLTSFSSDLSSLTNGESMFGTCSNLTSFSSHLSSLTNGEMLFERCKLDALSIKNIIDTINTYSDYLALGMGCNNTMEDKDLFAQEVGYTDMTSLLAALQAKGWTVEAQYNGRPTTTYSLRRPTEDTLPVFVKLEEVEKHADYTSEDGSKKFKLNWFHETTGSTDGYTQYATLEEAIESLNIKPIERN